MYSENVAEEFLNLMSVDYPPEMRLILMKSDYFKVWVMHNIGKWSSVNDLEDLMLLLGIDAESTLKL